MKLKAKTFSGLVCYRVLPIKNSLGLELNHEEIFLNKIHRD